MLAYDGEHCLGTVVCKMDRHKGTGMLRGYLAMLVVEQAYRALGVGAAWALNCGTAAVVTRWRADRQAGPSFRAALQLPGNQLLGV